MKCAICKSKADPENPSMNGAIFDINPYTFRKAWMHAVCFKEAIEVIKKEPSKNTNYLSKYDEYLTTFQ